jgi:hypothetical protein
MSDLIPEGYSPTAEILKKKTGQHLVDRTSAGRAGKLSDYMVLLKLCFTAA